MKHFKMRLVKSLGFLALFVVAVVWADDDAAAAPVADLDGRAKLLVSKQVSFMHRNQGWANPEKFSANPENTHNYF